MGGGGALGGGERVRQGDGKEWRFPSIIKKAVPMFVPNLFRGGNEEAAGGEGNMRGGKWEGSFRGGEGCGRGMEAKEV